MVFDPALGDVVQEQGDGQHRVMLRLDRLDQFAGQRNLGVVPAHDLVERADAADKMLVDRVVVIHVELHHRHDAAERMYEGAEHAGFVHAAQHDFGRVRRGQDLQEQPVGFRVLAHVLVDQLERTRGGAHRFRVKFEIVLLRQPEQAEKIDRIAPEHVGARNIDAVVIDDEIVAQFFRARRRAETRHHPAEHRRRGGLALL